MKAISLHQPWAPPRHMVGKEIAIHAAKRKPRASEWNHAIQQIMMTKPIDEGVLFGPRLPLGFVVATATLSAVLKVDHVDYGQRPALIYWGIIAQISQMAAKPLDFYPRFG